MKPSPPGGPVVILRDCLHSLSRACGGPVEEGGLLLGTRGSGGSLVYDARPLPGALRTPRTFLPLRWRPPAPLRGDVVGWFHSHPGGGLHMSREDVRVHRHLFPRGPGLALVLNGEGVALYGGRPLAPVGVLQVL